MFEIIFAAQPTCRHAVSVCPSCCLSRSRIVNNKPLWQYSDTDPPLSRATRSLAVAEIPRDVSCHWRFCRRSVTQGHWKWYHSKARVRFPIRIPEKVIMALPCIISEIKRVIGRKSRFFHTPCIQRPRQPVVISYHIFIWSTHIWHCRNERHGKLMVNTVWWCVEPLRQNTGVWQTDELVTA